MDAVKTVVASRRLQYLRTLSSVGQNGRSRKRIASIQSKRSVFSKISRSATTQNKRGVKCGACRPRSKIDFVFSTLRGNWRKGWDSNPRYPCRHAGFQDRCLKPLGHPSVSNNNHLGTGVCVFLRLLAPDWHRRRNGTGWDVLILPLQTTLP